MATMDLPLEDITLDTRLQMREKMDFAVIEEYAESIDHLPPAEVVRQGEVFWLTNGWHTYHAHSHAKRKEMKCKVVEGTFLDALIAAAGANHDHGLRRTTEDKRRAVRALLSEPTWTNNSDRMIAEACKVTHPFVSKVRSDFSTGNVSSSDYQNVIIDANNDGEAESVNSEEPSKDNKRTGKDGKARKVRKKMCDNCKHRKELGRPMIEGCEDCKALRKPKKAKPSKAVEEEPDDKPWLDEWGISITKEASAAFKDQEKFDELLKLLRKAKSLYKELANLPGGKYLQQSFISANTRDGFRHNGLETCIKNVKDCRPTYTVCPYAYNEHEPHGKDCSFCKGLGWLCDVNLDCVSEKLIKAAKKANGAS